MMQPDCKLNDYSYLTYTEHKDSRVSDLHADILDSIFYESIHSLSDVSNFIEHELILKLAPLTIFEKGFTYKHFMLDIRQNAQIWFRLLYTQDC